MLVQRRVFGSCRVGRLRLRNCAAPPLSNPHDSRQRVNSWWPFSPSRPRQDIRWTSARPSRPRPGPSRASRHPARRVGRQLVNYWCHCARVVDFFQLPRRVWSQDLLVWPQVHRFHLSEDTTRLPYASLCLLWDQRYVSDILGVDKG